MCLTCPLHNFTLKGLDPRSFWGEMNMGRDLVHVERKLRHVGRSLGHVARDFEVHRPSLWAYRLPGLCDETPFRKSSRRKLSCCPENCQKKSRNTLCGASFWGRSNASHNC